MRRPGFMKRILTPAERCYCTTPERVAGRWAAKEAVAKAVGTHLGWLDLEILPSHGGEPIIHWLKNEPDGVRVLLSITHTDSTAAAFAIAES